MYNENDFDYIDFANELGSSESSQSYQAYNGLAWGRYQFIESTIIEVANYLNIPIKLEQDFLNDQGYQDIIYKGYVQILINDINKNNIDQFIGNYITGKTNNITSQINIYGLVAGGWLGGPGGLTKYFYDNYDAKDFNGTYISDYIAKFSVNDLNKKKV